MLYHDNFGVRRNQRYARIYAYEADIYYQQCRRGPDRAGRVLRGSHRRLLGYAVGKDGNQVGATFAGRIAAIAPLRILSQYAPHGPIRAPLRQVKEYRPKRILRAKGYERLPYMGELQHRVAAWKARPKGSVIGCTR